MEEISELSVKHSLLVFGDLQCSSQIGNVSKFKNFDLICPTEKESRIALAAQNEGIEWVANTLMKKTNTRNLVMKLGSDGFITYETGADGYINRQHFPALSIHPADVTGAGDNFIATLAFMLWKNKSITESIDISLKYATESVKHVGNFFNDIKNIKE